MNIPIRAAPGIRNIKRLFLGPSTVESEAYQQEILCEEEKASIHPAIFLPEQLERITGTSPETTKEAEVAAATSHIATHARTIAYHIKNTILFDGSIYCGRLRYLAADKSLFTSTSPEPRQLETIGLASSHIGNRYFGHWLLDDCTRYLLAEQTGQPLCIRRPVSPLDHQQKYQTYFDQNWIPLDRARIDHLIIYQDFAQNSLKRARYRALRNRISGQFPRGSGSALVYLKRGTSGVRRVVQNEDEIINVLEKHGFKVVSAESDGLENLLKVLATARLVISIEGSHATHCAYSVPETSGFIVLQPPDRFVAWHRGWSEAVGVRFGFVVGAVGEEGYRFSASEILCTVDLMLRSLEHE